eukprot:Tbor_TRINITY_DN769_c0_g1::TRINITY_DN769_c0_g1_i1::g.3324::m.3324
MQSLSSKQVQGASHASVQSPVTVYTPCGRYVVCYEKRQGKKVFSSTGGNTRSSALHFEVYLNDGSGSVSSSSRGSVYMYTAIVNEEMVDEITSRAGVKMGIEAFSDMVFAALLGRSPASLRFYVETFEEMRRRYMGPSIAAGEETHQIDSPKDYFITIDYKADFFKAIFPLPLCCVERRAHQHVEGRLISGASVPSSVNCSSVSLNQPHYNGVTSLEPLDPSVSHVIQHTNSPAYHHTTPISQNLQPPHGANNGPVVPSYVYHQQQLCFQEETQRYRSRIETLENDEKKLKKENEALAKLAKDKMFTMQQECGDIQRKVIKDQEELKRLRADNARLIKELNIAKRERDQYKDRLTSANGRIRSLGGSPRPPIRLQSSCNGMYNGSQNSSLDRRSGGCSSTSSRYGTGSHFRKEAGFRHGGTRTRTQSCCSSTGSDNSVVRVREAQNGNRRSDPSPSAQLGNSGRRFDTPPYRRFSEKHAIPSRNLRSHRTPPSRTMSSDRMQSSEPQRGRSSSSNIPYCSVSDGTMTPGSVSAISKRRGRPPTSRFDSPKPAFR